MSNTSKQKYILLLARVMKIIKNFVINIIINGAILYAIVHYIPELWFNIQSIYKDTYIIFGILGVIFWILNSVLKRILNILTLPVKIITLGISSLIINIMVLYVFGRVVNYLDVGISIQLGSMVQTCILSCIISVIYFLIKKII